MVSTLSGILTLTIVAYFNLFAVGQEAVDTKNHDPLERSRRPASPPLSIIDPVPKLPEESDSDQHWLPDQITAFFSNDAAFGTVISSIIFLQAIILFAMGQPLISRSGLVKIWEGNINGPENSQQMFDWYTFTHVLHGVIFYGFGVFLALIWPSVDVGVKALYILALLIEVLWEIVENTPMVINRYRSTALAQGYVGDSILNSVCDSVAMTIGFWMAYLLPPWLVVILAISEEVILALLIRDNLTLNVIQLLFPSEAISKWQAGGGGGGNEAVTEETKLNEEKTEK